MRVSIKSFSAFDREEKSIGCYIKSFRSVVIVAEVNDRRWRYCCVICHKQSVAAGSAE